MLTIEDGALSTQHTMLLVLSLVLGAVVGEALDIETRLDDFGCSWCQTRFSGSSEDGRSACRALWPRLCCFAWVQWRLWARSRDGLKTANPSILIAKAVLDGVSSVIFAASLGKGVCLSILPLFIYQGGITLLARFIRPWLTDALISQISCIGSVLIFAIGFNLMFDKKVKVGNLLPAVLFPIILFFLRAFPSSLRWAHCKHKKRRPHSPLFVIMSYRRLSPSRCGAAPD